MHRGRSDGREDAGDDRAAQRVILAGEIIGVASVPLAIVLQTMEARIFGVFASIPVIATGVAAATVAVVLRLAGEHRANHARGRDG